MGRNVFISVLLVVLSAVTRPDDLELMLIKFRPSIEISRKIGH